VGVSGQSTATFAKKQKDRLEFAKLTGLEKSSSKAAFGSSTVTFTGSEQVSSAQPLELRFATPRRLSLIELSTLSSSAVLTIGSVSSTKRQTSFPLADGANDVSSIVLAPHSVYSISVASGSAQVLAIEVEPGASGVTSAPTTGTDGALRDDSTVSTAGDGEFPFWIIGAAVGGCFVIVAAVGLFIFVRQKKKKRNATPSTPGSGDVNLRPMGEQYQALDVTKPMYADMAMTTAMSTGGIYAPPGMVSAVIGTYGAAPSQQPSAEGIVGAYHPAPSESAESYLPLPFDAATRGP
jgi:hypothetical protein